MTGATRTAGRAAAALAVAGAAHAAVNARLLRRPPPPTILCRHAERHAADLHKIAPTVLVPARDEAERIERCVRSVDGPVLVLDDASSDGTGARAAASGATVLRGTEPPPGWYGKAWACAQLAAATDEDVLVFVDADVVLAPGAAAAVGLLESSGLDVVCPFPRQVAVTWPERLVQPLLAWSWLTTLPLRVAERSPRPSLTAACGQFLVIRRAALERIGGFAAVRGDVLDDLALVRAVKAAGGRGGVVDGTRLAECRMYTSWPQLREGYGKSLWRAFPLPVLGVLLGVYVLPVLAALRGSRAGRVAYLAGVASRVISARRTGGRALDAPMHPLSILLLAYLRVWSARNRVHVEWKGRRPPAPAR